jgi:hypothetical protein
MIIFGPKFFLDVIAIKACDFSDFHPINLI